MRPFEACRDYLLAVANHAVADDIRQKVAPSDLVQQTLFEACRGFNRFEGQTEGELYAWLRRILLNNVSDVTCGFRGTEKRNVAREVPLDGDDSRRAEHLGLIAEQPSPSARAEVREEKDLLAAALARMPIHYATAIRLRNLEFRSFAEIAAANNTTAESARKLWERAVKRLALELKPTHDST